MALQMVCQTTFHFLYICIYIVYIYLYITYHTFTLVQISMVDAAELVPNVYVGQLELKKICHNH